MKDYYFVCNIMRNGAPIMRQGIIKAEDALKAIDRVHNMGRQIWKRVIVDCTILDPVSGEIQATSKVGEAVGKKLLPAPTEAPKQGFVPFNQQYNDIFVASSIGTYFAPMSFNSYV